MVTKRELRYLATQLDEKGSRLIMDILKYVNGDETFYTSLLAQDLNYTWANTHKAVKKLVDYGVLKTCQYWESMYGNMRKVNNITGLILTPKGNMVRSLLFSRKKGDK